MTSGDRLLKVLWLFSADRPVWEVGEIARTLRTSLSTAYRYVGQLTEAGFLVSAGSLGYTLGPAIIELDRRIRTADPLVQCAASVQKQLLADVGREATILLCRLYRDQVMCVAQSEGADAPPSLSYERGRPMPLLRGAPSKAILAHLPTRAAERLWDAETHEGAADWDSFKAQLTKIRKAGAVVSHGEVDPGVVGIAAPVFDAQGRPVGAICTVLPAASVSPAVAARVSTLTRASADEISAMLFEQESALSRPQASNTG